MKTLLILVTLLLLGCTTKASCDSRVKMLFPDQEYKTSMIYSKRLYHFPASNRYFYCTTSLFYKELSPINWK